MDNGGVNLSPLQFASPALLDSVREVLHRHRIEPARLTLEIPRPRR